MHEFPGFKFGMDEPNEAYGWRFTFDVFWLLSLALFVQNFQGSEK